MTREKLFTCKKCGRPTPNYQPYSPAMAEITEEPGFSYCDECMDHMLKMQKWKNVQFETMELVCPWCGYQERDSWELADSDDEYECPDCGKTFAFERNIEVTYTSWRRKEDYPGDGAADG